MDLPPFQRLLDDHAGDVQRLLVATVGRIDAEDCYQETWLSALRAYPRLRDASNLRSWLLTIAQRKAIDHVRARGRRPLPVAVVPERAAPAEPGPGIPEIFDHVRALPPKQRMAVALRCVLDTPYADIATVMQTSEEAARRSVHEGLNRLRKDYQP